MYTKEQGWIYKGGGAPPPLPNENLGGAGGAKLVL